MLWGTTVFFSGLDDSNQGLSWEHKYYKQNAKGQMIAQSGNKGDKKNVQIWVQKRAFPWKKAGTLKDFDNVVKTYPHFAYEYATDYNTWGSSVSTVVLSSWKQGYRLTQQPLIPTGDRGAGMHFGTSVFTRDLSVQNGKVSRDKIWKQFYYIQDTNGKMSFIGGNGDSNDVTFYVKKRLNPWAYAGKVSDLSTIAAKYPFTKFDYGMKYQEVAGSIHDVVVNSWNKGIRVFRCCVECRADTSVSFILPSNFV